MSTLQMILGYSDHKCIQ